MSDFHVHGRKGQGRRGETGDESNIKMEKEREKEGKWEEYNRMRRKIYNRRRKVEKKRGIKERRVNKGGI